MKVMKQEELHDSDRKANKARYEFVIKAVHNGEKG